MIVDVDSSVPLRFGDGRPVRAASGLAPYAGGWLVVQDDATSACVWDGETGQPLRLLPPVRGVDHFEESAGTKALKPDLEAAVPLPDGSVLVLGSGSTPARMRSVLLSPAAVVVADLTPVYARVAQALGVVPDQLNLEGACVVGEVLRWFQRGLPSSGSPTGSVDVALTDLLGLVSGRPAAVRVSAPRHYDLGEVDGIGLAVTDAVALPGGLVLVCAAAEDSASTYDDGPVVGSALALLDGDRVLDVAELPQSDVEVGAGVVKAEGLALDGAVGDPLRVVAVTDADDPEVPSRLLRLSVSR